MRVLIKPFNYTTSVRIESNETVPSKLFLSFFLKSELFNLLIFFVSARTREELKFKKM